MANPLLRVGLVGSEPGSLCCDMLPWLGLRGLVPLPLCWNLTSLLDCITERGSHDGPEVVGSRSAI